MVNIGKRMRKLKPLLSIRSGPGAAILPPPPKPQVKHVRLQLPLGGWAGAGGPGAHYFWRKHLPRLKYHNPALPITVQQEKGDVSTDPMTLTLRFESEDGEALRRMAERARIGRVRRAEGVGETEKQKVKREKSMTITAEKKAQRQSSSPPREGVPAHKRTDERLHLKDGMSVSERGDGEAPQPKVDGSVPEVDRAQQSTDSIPLPQEDETPNSEGGVPVLEGGYTARELLSVEIGDVVLKSRKSSASPDEGTAAAETATASPPIYTSSLTLDLKGLTAHRIYLWFRRQTHCTEVMRSAEDKADWQALSSTFEQSKIDRALVKADVDQRKANDAMLKKARGEMEQLRAEA